MNHSLPVSNEQDDPYKNPPVIMTGDEYAIRIKDGIISHGAKLEKDRSSIWKGSQKIQALSDEAITVLRTMAFGQDHLQNYGNHRFVESSA